MDNQIPNEDDLNKQFQDLPLPDADLSWQKMEELLEEKEDKRRFIPFFYRYGLWLLGLMLIGAAGTWLLRSNTVHENNAVTSKQQTQTASPESSATPLEDRVKASEHNENLDVTAANSSKSIKAENAIPAKTDNIPKKPGSQKQTNSTENTLASSGVALTTAPDAKTKNNTKGTVTNSAKQYSVKTDELVQNTSTKTDSKSSKESTAVEGFNHQSNTPNPGFAFSDNEKELKQPATNLPVLPLQSLDGNEAALGKDVTDLTAPQTATNILKNDSLLITADKVAVDSSSTLSASGKIKKNTHPFVFAVGLVELQQIPIAGQSTAKYNDNGNTNILKDYIPAVYVSLQKGNWFLQASFKYAGAQYVTQNNFYQQTSYEAATQKTIQNISSVQKIYYNQLPLSINYYIRPRWSVGAGGTFNWLHSTIIENKRTTTDLNTGNRLSETMQVRAVKAFTDSFFYASHFQLMLQTAYDWKRFSFGLRYSWGVQPYMKYTAPNGAINTQTAQSLQLLIRLRLWEHNLKK